MPQNTESREQVKNNLAAEVLRTRGKVRLAAFGYSMLPTLWPGDLLTVEARGFEQTRVGNVVLFTRDGRFFIHRVLQKVEFGSERYLVARGDAMPDVDAPVMPEQVLGQVIAVHRKHRDVALPACSTIPRFAGLLLSASGRLRSLALRWHAWRSRNELSKSEIAQMQAS
jgi:signal peptidase I